MCKNKRRGLLLLIILILTLLVIKYGNLLMSHFNYPSFMERLPFGAKCEVPLAISSQDNNQNGIADALDIVDGARQEVKRGTQYDSSYYSKGYPPEGKGACTDVIWRALQTAGYDLRALVDDDIKKAPAAYGTTGKNPDSAIDYRRVRNLQVFFQRHAEELTTKVKPRDIENLVNWQPGDIVVFAPPLEHIGVISDRRRRDGVPLVIHNGGPRAREADALTNWPTKIIYHFRFISDKKAEAL
ncbi:MAG: DUF1287 domain-containing protein [Syntrophomonas sp.]|uniref:DUF1287 domain-containing protein n=1 Tax=Syntrophomonas sp. TaxID=2053627 RepID=UPI00260622C2|nr:DUF1287 domain-containing protein [Syntrophomonas sp.]MDD2510820.1 DUF1287 domain-containing protein [Syntrophomonas sp.]MDD4627264.1 DUF1287 domain-containing protein [Syntrophomonas sp.]